MKRSKKEKKIIRVSNKNYHDLTNNAAIVKQHGTCKKKTEREISGTKQKEKNKILLQNNLHYDKVDIFSQ